MLIHAKDLLHFSECRHSAWLRSRGCPDQPLPPSPRSLRLRAAGHRFETEIIRELPAGSVLIDTDLPEEEQRRLTREALEAGAPAIHQARLLSGDLAGQADFIIRQADGSWQITEAKLAAEPRPEHLLQIQHYAVLLEASISQAPSRLSLRHGLGDREKDYPVDVSKAYHGEILSQMRRFLQAPPESEPHWTHFCRSCRFSERCRDERRERGHLSQLNGLKSSAAAALAAHGVRTLQQLLDAEPQSLSGVADPSIIHSWRLQARALIENQPQQRHDRHLSLPDPNAPVIYLHLPASAGRLGLAGVALLLSSGRCEAIACRDRDSEKQALERLFLFLFRQLQRQPQMRIVVASPAERRALHELSSRHDLMMDEVDALLEKEGQLLALSEALRRSVALPLPAGNLADTFAYLCPDSTQAWGDASAEHELWLAGDPEASEASVCQALASDVGLLRQAHLGALKLFAD